MLSESSAIRARLTPLLFALLLASCTSVTLPRIEASQVTLRLLGEPVDEFSVTVVDGRQRFRHSPDAQGHVELQLPGRPQRTYALVLGVVPVWSSGPVFVEFYDGDKRVRKLSQKQILELPRDDAGEIVVRLP